MIGGLMKTTSRFAVAAAAGLFVGGIALTPAQAADLGGDCCADLEERVAELEATTVRKGNRKVSVKLSGQVNRALLFWDDGDESDVYSVDNNTTNTRIRLTGDAKFKPGWSAGYYLEWQTVSTSSGSVNQLTPSAGASDFGLRHAVWYIKSDKLGSVWLGQHSMATDNLIYMNVVGTSVSNGGGDLLSGGGFLLTQPGVTGNARLVGASWGTYYANFDVGNRSDIIRYDSPDIWGCVFSTAWGENDDWDVALRCKKELNSVKILFGIGYIEHTGNEGSVVGDGTSLLTGAIHGQNDFIVSAGILHDPTGLFLTGWYADRDFDSITNQTTGGAAIALGTGVTAPGDVETWYIEGGIYRRFNDLGKTALYINYAESEGSNVGVIDRLPLTGGGISAATSVVLSSEVQIWGGGIVQEITNAAMELYIDYKHLEFDGRVCNAGFTAAAGCPAGQTLNVTSDDLDLVLVGGRIKF
ncbi:MAG: hypothetical protein VX871_08520 [Pseudomonadota bacterium]|nr:hypothetical protein [Pseudomonadota bacterium]